MPPFDMDAFLKDFQPTDVGLLLATIHYLWMDHPLKIEHSIGLVALSEKVVIDLSDVQSIRMKNGDYEISYKSNGEDDIIFADTPEFVALQMAILAMRTRGHKEH